MSAEACAALVERGDPDRWRSAMTAPAGRARDGLMALYALNLEVARAPWVAREPLLVEIRLQWWLDAIGEIFEGGPVRRHEVVGPLAETVRASGLPRVLLEALISARRLERAGFPERSALVAHADATAGNLMALAATHLGAGPEALPVVRDFARGAGLAAWLRAVPALAAWGVTPLPGDATPAGLAAEGRAALAAARAGRGRVPRTALPALLAGWRADGILARALADPGAVAAGGLEGPEARARAVLVWRALSGRW